ncbi:MAG: patatin-like phospholipase family protein [Actinomycetota bacterium]|nr:patatin-like phospholipase family protein [Actinomycetota bacterium]
MTQSTNSSRGGRSRSTASVPAATPPVRPATAVDNGVALVLGGGGAVGIAYHCGVLRALEEVGGLDVRACRVIIGTSAGAVVGAEMRLGRSYEDIVALAGGDEPSTGLDALKPPPVMAPAWQSRADLYRRVVGSTWSVSRALFRIPLPQPPKAVQRLFPPALFSLDDEVWAAHGIPEEWPEGRLWLVTVDIDTGRRVVLKQPTSPAQTGTLRQGIAASTAVPALYPPVHVGKRRLVDGGVHSPTSLDLAARTDCGTVVCVAPMAFDPARPPGAIGAISRNRFNSQLDREAGVVRRAGADVLLIRPCGDELKLHNVNLLRRAGNEAVMHAAYEATAVQLSSRHAHQVLAPARAAQDAAFASRAAHVATSSPAAALARTAG